MVLFGLGVGLISLARAALVADLYGVAAYASINGVLAFPLTIARAAAPVTAAALHAATGSYRQVLVAVALCATFASLAMARAHQLGRYQKLPTANEQPRRNDAAVERWAAIPNLGAVRCVGERFPRRRRR